MIRNAYKVLAILALIFALPLLSWAQPSAELGAELFKVNCAACHSKNMKSAATGPPLGGVQERWADYPEEDLYAWIKNSQAMIAAAHPKAVELWDEWKPAVMQAFPNLTDEDIASVLLYIEAVDAGTFGGPAQDAAALPAEEEKETPAWLYWTLFFFLLLLSVILARIISNLNVLAAKKEGREYERKTLLQILTGKGVITFAIFAAVILGGYTTVNNAIALGRQQGYAPVQPINFSHELHAGVHEIDCQYCHDGARRSKHAGIPSASTCMNCHRAITVGSEFGTAEITKIFASIGYNPNDNSYVEDYENMSNEDIKAMYSKWIADNYMRDEELTELDQEGQNVVEEQWNNIVESLTNDQKEKIQGPIEWIRIHNLPDHVYFNHAQHVGVGEVACQTCHGPVEEMELLEQFTPLSMGWCINCHRETAVKFKGNEYYDSYIRLHEELISGERDKVTVEDIGGLECQKCHY